MSDKSRSTVNGPNAIFAAGILAFLAVVYGVVFHSGSEVPDEVSAVIEPSPVGDAPVAAEPEETISEPDVVATEPPEETEAEVAVVLPESAEPTPSDDAPSAVDHAVETSEDTATAQDAPAQEPEVEKPDAPRFDVVRIDPLGSAVIAGDAAPGAEVRLLVDGEEITKTIADNSGKFVALFEMPPSDDPRSLTAELAHSDGTVVASEGAVLIAPVRPVETAEAEPEAQTEDVAVSEPNLETEEVAVAEPEQTTASPRTDTESASTPQIADADAANDDTDVPTAVAEVPAMEAPRAPDSPTIVLADNTGVTVLQPAPQPAAPSNDGPSVTANLVIDTITYDPEGEVALTGRGAGESFARVYLNDKVIQTVKIGPDGTWRTPLPDVDAGVYRLRIDEVTAEGDVTSRVETPFQREEPEVAAISVQRPNAVTVQSGFTLWAIAKDRFGEGREYVRVYEANRDLIRDPDLIYPGQVFEIPEG